MSELETSEQKPRLLRVVSKCSSVDEFVALFSRFCDGNSLFIVTRKPKPAGTRQPVCLTLADGTPMIAGTGQVIDAFERPDGPFKRPGMRIEFPDLDDRGQDMFNRLAGRVPRTAPPPPPSPATPAAAETDAADGAAEEPTTVADTQTGVGAAAAAAAVAAAERAEHAATIIPANPLSELTDESLEGFVECQIYEESSVIEVPLPGGEAPSSVEAADTSIPGGLPAWWPSAKGETVPANPLAGLADDEIEAAPRAATGADDAPMGGVAPLPQPAGVSMPGDGGAPESAGAVAAPPSAATEAIAVVPPPRVPASGVGPEGKRPGSQSGAHALPKPPAPLSSRMALVAPSATRAPSSAPTPGLPPLAASDGDAALVHDPAPEPDTMADGAEPWFAAGSSPPVAAADANPMLLAPTNGQNSTLGAMVAESRPMSDRLSGIAQAIAEVSTPIWKRPAVLAAVALTIGLGLGFALFGGGRGDGDAAAANGSAPDDERTVVAAAAARGGRDEVSDVAPGDDVGRVVPIGRGGPSTETDVDDEFEAELDRDGEQGVGDAIAEPAAAGIDEDDGDEDDDADADDGDEDVADDAEVADSDDLKTDDRAAAAATGECSIDVRSRPDGAPIFVDGKPAGARTPAVVQAACGSVEVSVRHPRYATRSRTVRATPDGASVSLTMSRPSYKVLVTSKPTGATVKVNGRKVGTTPASVSVTGYEKANIEITKFGFKPVKRRVYVRKNKQRVTLRMKPLARGLFKSR